MKKGSKKLHQDRILIQKKMGKLLDIVCRQQVALVNPDIQMLVIEIIQKTTSSKQILLKIFSGFVFHICVDVTPLSFTLYSANIRVHLDNF